MRPALCSLSLLLITGVIHAVSPAVSSESATVSPSGSSRPGPIEVLFPLPGSTVRYPPLVLQSLREFEASPPVPDRLPIVLDVHSLVLQPGDVVCIDSTLTPDNPSCSSATRLLFLSGAFEGPQAVAVTLCHQPEAGGGRSCDVTTTTTVPFVVTPTPAKSQAVASPCDVDPQGLWCVGKQYMDAGLHLAALQCFLEWLNARYADMGLYPAARAQFREAVSVSLAYRFVSIALSHLNQHRAAASTAQDAILWASFVYQRVGDAPFKAVGSAFDVLFVNTLSAAQTAVLPPNESRPPPLPRFNGTATTTIGIVTLCDYDPAATPLTDLSFDNRRRYAARHGYGLHLYDKRQVSDRPHAWSKIKVVERHLGQYEWVMWVDCDSFFMDMDQRVDVLLPASAGVDMVISQDGAFVNTGVWMVRNSPEGRTLLHQWYGTPDSPFVEHGWWEQGALHYLTSTTAAHTHCGLAPSRWAPRVHIHPQGWMNSYPPLLARQLRRSDTNAPLHTIYNAGDFIVSFSGCRVFGTPEVCNQLYNTYAAQAG